MSNATARSGGPVASGPDRAQAEPLDWIRIERSPEFRELTSRRHRFIAAAGAVTFGGFLLYLGLATFAGDFMGSTVGGVPVAWLAAMTQVLMTWVITWLYLRRAEREFAPLERRVADRAGPRFTREDDPAARAADTTEGSAR